MRKITQRVSGDHTLRSVRSAGVECPAQTSPVEVPSRAGECNLHEEQSKEQPSLNYAAEENPASARMAPHLV